MPAADRQIRCTPVTMRVDMVNGMGSVPLTNEVLSGITKTNPKDPCLAATSIDSIQITSSNFDHPASLTVVTGKGNPLPSGCSHVFADKTGATGYHGVFQAGAHAHENVHIKLDPHDLPVPAETIAKVKSRSERWVRHLGQTAQQLTANFETMTAASPNGEQTRVLVPEEPSASAMSQLLHLNTDAKVGTIANYAPSVRHVVEGKTGAKCVVMTQEDVTSLADTLADTLAPQHQVSHENGINFKFASLSPQKGTTSGTVNFLVHRTPIAATSTAPEAGEDASTADKQRHQARLAAVFSKSAGSQQKINVVAAAQTKTAYAATKENEDESEDEA